MKRKSSRRLLFLVGAAGVAVVAFGAVLGLRAWNQSRNTADFRAKGMALVQEKKYYAALEPLKKYLDKKPEDREALVAYATAREQVEDPESKHILQTISVLQKAHAMDRADKETSMRLLELCVTAGLNAEAVSLAEEMRPADLTQTTKEHLPVLRAEGSSRVRLQKTDPKSGEVLTRILELDPKDFGTRVVFLEWLRDTGKRDKARDVASQFAAAHKDDPRAKLLTVLSRNGEPGYDAQGELFRALCDINGLDPDSAGPVRQVKYENSLDVLRSVALFDGLTMHQHALAVLIEGAHQVSDDVLLRMIARRAWMSSRPGDVVALTEKIDLSPAGAHTELLAFRALSLIDTGKVDEAKPVIEAIGQRTGDFRASAWKLAFPALTANPPLAPEDKAIAIMDAMKKAPAEPVLTVLRADALAAAGRTSEAREEWKRATTSPLSVGWTRPWLNHAYSLLGEGRALAALESATQAYRMAPRSMAVFLGLFRSDIALLQTGYEKKMSPGPADLLSLTNRLESELALNTASDALAFRQNVLPGRVQLTARVKGKDAANTLLKESLAQFKDLPQANLQELLSVVESEGLQGREELVAKLSAPGMLTPDAALTIALSDKDHGAGKAMLDAGLASASDAMKPQWRIAQLRFAENTGEGKSTKQSWAALCEDFPKNLDVQMAALTSPGVMSDLALVEKLSARAVELGKFETLKLPATLRFARARALLSDPVTEKNRLEALEILRALIASERDWVDARSLLVSGLTMDKPDAGIRPIPVEAAEQIQALLPMVPDPRPLDLELARLSASKGDLASAKARLENITSDASAPLGLRLQAVEMLIAQRELESAAGALERMESKGTPQQSTEIKVRLAGVYRSLTRDRQALLLLRELAGGELYGAEQITAVATDLASLGDVAPARTLLSRLDGLSLAPGMKESHLAHFSARFGSAEETIALLRASVDKRKTDPDAWTDLVSYLSERNMATEARAAIAEAKAALPGNARIATLDRQVELVASARTGPLDLEAIAKVLDGQPGMQARASAIREVEKARAAGELTNPSAVDTLALRHVKDPVVQTVLAQLLMRQQTPDANRAMEIMRRTLREHPRSSEAASYATDLFRQTGATSEMLNAARAWQQLTRDPYADVATAEALLTLDQPENAMNSLRSLVEGAKMDPEGILSLRVMDLAARSLNKAGKQDEAFNLFAETAAKSAKMRTLVWLPVAGQAVSPVESAVRWIDRVKSAASTGSIDDRLALASAYTNLSQRYPATAGANLDAALGVITPMATGDAPVGVYEALGTIQQMRGEPAKAAQAFETAATRDAKAVGPLRSLALLSLAGDAGKAVTYAERAAALSPADLETQSVLARCLFAHGQSQTARADAGATQTFLRAADAYQGVLKVQPGNGPAMLGAILSLDSAGKVRDTLPLYARMLDLDRMPPSATRAAIQNNYADAIVRAGGSMDELGTARRMALEATKAEPAGVTFDTLGMVEAAAGNRGDAVTAYKRALQLDPKLESAQLGLATLYTTGSAQEQTEAGAMLTALTRSADKSIAEKAAKVKAAAGK